MNRFGVILLCIAQSVVVSAWGQEKTNLGSLLPAPQSPSAQLSARFLFAEKTASGPEVEVQVRDQILQVVGEEGVELSIECRVSICRAGLISSPEVDSLSPLWEAKGTQELLAWEKSPLSELAEDTGFDGIAPVRMSYSDGSRQLLLYFYDSE